MTLREQFKSYRVQYDAIAYQGDLARQIIPSRMRLRNTLFLGGFAASAIAAAAVVGALLLQPLPLPSSNPSPSSVALVQQIPMSDEVKSEWSSIQNAAHELFPMEQWHVPSWDELMSRNG